MFSAVAGKVLSSVYSSVEFIQKKGLSQFIFNKLEERNPFHSSPEHTKQVKVLTKNLSILKGIKKHFIARLIERRNDELQHKLHNLNHRIVHLTYHLNYLKQQEQGMMILKWATPCNLILPGTGNIIRTAAYTLKLINVCKSFFYNRREEELRQFLQEITIAHTVSVITTGIYDTIHHIKKLITYENFRSIFYY
jgi:hypothetical protein